MQEEPLDNLLCFSLFVMNCCAIEQHLYVRQKIQYFASEGITAVKMWKASIFLRVVIKVRSLSLLGNIKSLSLSIFPLLGAVALDSPQDPVPVSSVSLIPPPPPKNAARMLALALAESAQQASAQSQKKPGDAHSESTSYGETEAATALEKLHLSAGAPDKLHLYTDLPENQLHFQTSAPVEQDFQASSTAREQNHPPGAPGSQDPQPLHTSVPGDVPARRDAEQEQSSYLAGQTENKEQFPAHAEDWEQTRQHAPGALPDWEPPTTNLPMDKPHVRACTSGDKQLTSTCAADDKLETPVTAGEKSTPVPVPYLTTIQTAAAEPTRAPTCQHAAGPAIIQADVTGTSAQRTPTGSQPAPPQRQDHQSAVGQVPAASAKASSNSSQVRGCAPCSALHLFASAVSVHSSSIMIGD